MMGSGDLASAGVWLSSSARLEEQAASQAALLVAEIISLIKPAAGAFPIHRKSTTRGSNAVPEAN